MTWTRRAGLGPVLGGMEREDVVQVCVGAQALHTHRVCPPACHPAGLCAPSRLQRHP